MEATAEKNKVLVDFISNVPHSRVAVIVPLYGYWKDLPNEQLDGATLSYAMAGLTSAKHQQYLIVVAEPDRITKEVADVLFGKEQAGNMRGVSMPSHKSSYADYLNEGIEYALQNTDAQFLVICNPWIALKSQATDRIIDRVNSGDVAVISGYDMRELISPEEFAEYEFNLPKEEFDSNLDFAGFTRQIAEFVQFDENYKTHFFLARDFWQKMKNNNFAVISSQFVPIFSFKLDWTLVESEEDFEHDQKYFLEKWGFEPTEVNYKR